MSKFLLRILVGLPWLGLIVYGLAIYNHYSSWLDGSLIYRTPETTPAVADILGLGFWPTWLAVIVCMGILGGLALVGGLQRRGLIAVAVCFGGLSFLDYYFYQVLSSQVLK
jgi:hypothetical protein